MCMCAATADGSFITAMVAVVDGFGWTTFDAVVQKQVSQIVHTMDGAAIEAVHTQKMSLSRATRPLFKKVCTGTSKIL